MRAANERLHRIRESAAVQDALRALHDNRRQMEWGIEQEQQNRGGGRRRLDSFGKVAGNFVTELVGDIGEAIATAINAIGDFFDGLGESSFELVSVENIKLQALSLCELLETGAASARISFSLTLFPSVCFAGACIDLILKDITVTFDPARMWQAIIDAIQDKITDMLQELDSEDLASPL